MSTVLSETQRVEIFQKYVDGDSKASLARMYGVSPRTIGRVIAAIEADNEQSTLDHIDHYVLSQEYEDDHDQWEDSLDDADSIVDDRSEEEEEFWAEDEPEYEYHVVATPMSISITRVADDGSEPRTASIIPEDENFKTASDIVWSGRGSQESLANAFGVIDQKTFFESYSNGKITIDPEYGRVSYNTGNMSQEFSGRLVERLVGLLKDKDIDAVDNLCLFAERLALNESQEAVDGLYNFLEATCIDIDKEGYVIAFKKIREDFTDCYTGTIDNSVGQAPEVPRKAVDPNPNQTCSHGLHVCSSSYLRSFGGQRVMKVRVDPKDFVAVPRDYNDAKARVCRYEVIEDITDAYFANGENV